jgi:hypothetical protein
MKNKRIILVLGTDQKIRRTPFQKLTFTIEKELDKN